MIPGPRVVIACPHCGHLAWFGTLRSGNTFGAESWTDGAYWAPMLPRPPAVVQCRGCREAYWLESAAELGTIDEHAPPDWQVAEAVEAPTEAEFYRAIAKSSWQTASQERTLRLLAWRRHNDADRGGIHAFLCRRDSVPVPEFGLAEAHHKNLTRLIELLDPTMDDELILMAEIRRSLGEFDEARRLLSRAEGFGDPLRHHAQAIRNLCDRRSIKVRAVEGNEGLTDAERAAAALRVQQEGEMRRAREAAERAYNAPEAVAARRAQAAAAYDLWKQRERQRMKNLQARNCVCPRCGFEYGWNGQRCLHCRYSRSC